MNLTAELLATNAFDSSDGPLAQKCSAICLGDSVREQPDSTLATSATNPWFALRVKPNREKPVTAALQGRGMEAFLPLLRSQRQWSDRVKTMELPLFPGYLFCRLNLQDRMPLLTTPGFLYIVGVGRNPEVVDESEILGIQSLLQSGLAVTSWPSLVVGQKVQLQTGPLRGLQGVLTKIENQHRLYVSVTLLKRSVSVEVEPQWVRPVVETIEGVELPNEAQIATDGPSL